MNNDVATRNEEHVEVIKDSSNVRLMYLTAKGFDLWKCEKMERFLESCEKHQIDTMLLKKIKIKWNAVNLDEIE